MKKLIVDTLNEIEKAALPLFIRDLKLNTFMRLVLGELSKETSDLIIDTCNEYLREEEERKRKEAEEKAIAAKLEAHRRSEYRAPIVDISKLTMSGVQR